MTEQTPLSAQEIIELSKRYTLYDWQAQSKAMPIPVERAEGVLLLARPTARATSTSTRS